MTVSVVMEEQALVEGAKVSVRPDFSLFVGESGAMKSVFKTIGRLLDNDSTVLVLGESGTGKELVARAIHQNSNRADRPMIVVNCGAIPEELLESELFGHEKGSFTGAIRTRIGKFELADKGLIFLDEIGDMSPSLQVKLLRILQERKFERIGGAKTIDVDVRVIAATNKNLEQAITEGKFREDLYYRLNVIPVELPPLRDRGDDPLALINHFVRQFNKSKSRNVTGFTNEAMASLRAYKWPGNVRELEHMMERLVVLKGEGTIEKDDLPPKLRSAEIKKEDQVYRDMLLVGEPEDLAGQGQLFTDHLSAKNAVTSSPGRVAGLTIPNPQDGALKIANGAGLSRVILPESPVSISAGADMDDSNVALTAGFAVGDANPENAYTTIAANANAFHEPVLPREGINLKEAVDRYETTLILAALERCSWVKNKAATLLGLNRTTLVEKLKKKGLMNGVVEEGPAGIVEEGAA
jgi:transcriptional regulator with GAF, ATPase, and Fis domain